MGRCFVISKAAYAPAQPTGAAPLELRRALPSGDGGPLLASAVVLAAAPLLGWLVGQNPLVTLGLALAVAMELVLLRRPQVGVYLLLVGGYYDVFFLQAGFALLGPGDFAAFAVVPAWLLRVLVRRERYRPPAHLGLLVIFLGLAALSMALGIDAAAGRGPYLRTLTYVLSMLALLDLARDVGILQRVLWVMSLCAFGHAFFSMAFGDGTLRNGGLFDEPNVLAHHLCLGALATAGLLLQPRGRWLRYALVLVLGTILVGVVLTISRGAYLSLGAAFVWWLRRQRQAIVLVVVVVAAGAWVTRNIGQERTQFIEERFRMRDESVTNRWKTYQNAFLAIAEHPLIGIGYAQFMKLEKVVDLRAERGRGAHSFYLATLAETGVIAGGCLFGFVGLHGLALWRVRRRLDALNRAPDTGPGRGPEQRTENPRARGWRVARAVARPARQSLEDAAGGRWIVSVFQAMLLYHGIWLLVSGGNRVFDWAVLGLYLSAAAVGRRLVAAAEAVPPAEAPAQAQAAEVGQGASSSKGVSGVPGGSSGMGSGASSSP